MEASIVLSIGQNLYRTVSEGECKSYLSTCFYVCLSYTCSEAESYHFTLELETALAKAQYEVSTYQMPQIVIGEDNIEFHCK